MMRLSSLLPLAMAGALLILPVGSAPAMGAPDVTEAADAPRILLTDGTLSSEAVLRSRFGITAARPVGRHGWVSWRINTGMDPHAVARSIVCLDAAHSPCADADAVVTLAPMATRAVLVPQQSRIRTAFVPHEVRTTPNDPLYAQQWYHESVSMPLAFRYGDADAMRVAILDTGITAGHPDLAGAIEPGYDVVNGDSIPEDVNGHGTAVAGVVGAICDNGIGMCGTGKGALIIPIKVFGDGGTARTSDLVRGVDLAASMYADVAVMSWGYPTATAALASAIQDATAQGVAFVAAAGNDGQAYGPIFPASATWVLSVGGLNRDGTRRATANMVGLQGVMAPGTDILTTSTNGGYVFVDGSSVAAPVVGGCLAALRRQKLTRSPRAAQDVIRYSARSMVGVGSTMPTGWGMADCGAAMALEARPLPTLTPSVVAPVPSSTPTPSTVPTAQSGPTERATETAPTGTPTRATGPTSTRTPTISDVDAFIATAVAGTVQARGTMRAVVESRQTVWLPVLLSNVCPADAPCPSWSRVTPVPWMVHRAR